MSTAANPERGAELAALLHEVRRITLRTERLVDDLLVGGYRSVFRGSGLEFEEVREYSPGDDPRAVDWAVTARMAKPYVKTFVDERELPVVFVLDLSPSLRTGLGEWSPRAMAARLAAALGLAAVQNDDRVGMLACGAGIERWLAPRQGRERAMHVVRDCLALRSPQLEQTGRRAALGAGLDFLSRACPRTALVFVLSDLLGDEWQHALARCALRHDTICLRLLGPEWSAPPRALARLRDPISGEAFMVDGTSTRVREHYEERVHIERERVRAATLRARAELLEVEWPWEPTVEDVARPLLALFRARERGRRR